MASFEKRGKTVRVVVRLPGGGKRTATFDTMADARAWARESERKKAAGASFAADGVTVGDMLAAYLEDVGSQMDSARWNEIRIKTFLRNDTLAQKPLGNVMTYDINKWIQHRLKTPSERTGKPVSVATVNREINLLSAAFTYAIKARKWITENPCHEASRPPKGEARDRKLLTPEEIEAICTACGYTPDIALQCVFRSS